ncbi:MAG: 4a-hydroxytetrahydrobiopterin dehydratase [Anaerolineae bacterium]|nr:MAG: 4a-hydroxytetrahydrobiopterin dehydratase [Anaerolineae bacterium]WKZ45785.1 MAG: 4a-hydroxytetrahydrobiopterin dehydratase [Anaerolineales bacterium]
MSNLSQLKCVACRGGDPALTEAEIAELQPQTPDWQIVAQDTILRLQRVFKFKNYAEAADFTNKVAAIADAEDHHPLIILEWGRVTVQWWTHVVKGLHKNDFIMAAKTDEIFSLANG